MKNDSSEMEQIFEKSLEKFSIEVEHKLLSYSKISTEEAAQKAVEEFRRVIDEKLRLLGVDVDNPKDSYADFVHLRKWRERIDDLSMKVGSGIVMAILAGILALLAAGYRNFR